MQIDRQLRGYLWFCRWIFPRSYSIKFLAVAFLGIHAPLLTYVGYLAVKNGVAASLPSILVLLAATLVGTALTLWVQYLLLAPLRVTAEAVTGYRFRRELWPLPHTAPDEAGVLMRDTHECLTNLDRLMRLKDTLASSIAHDLRSPLTGIALNVDFLLLNPALTPPQRNVLAAIHRTADAQLAQVTGLLEAVLDETRNARFDLRPVKVADLWESVRSSLEPLANHQQITLTFLPTAAVVAADPARIVQVLNNLTSNALQATGPSGRVELSAVDLDGAWEIHVRDSGAGLDAVALTAKLRGEKLPAGGNHADARLGLGLRMVSSLLLLHASQLEIKSTPGQGSDFSFLLQEA